jgi:hypothetical protein
MKYFVSKTKGHKKKERDKMSHRLIFYETFQYDAQGLQLFQTQQ